MCKEKQIKEMANDLRQAEVWDDSDGVLNRTKTAKNLYKKGWRKQSEGEWLVEAYKEDEIITIPYIEHQHNEPFCSRCGKYALLDGKEDYVASNYCPNCGAKMKGCAE